MIDKKILDKIHNLIDKNRIVFDYDAEIDILKHGYNWTKDFIIECLKKGEIYTGTELYPNIKKRKNRYYCIHKHFLLNSKLILIGFLILEDLLIIHIQPLNKNSREGRIYYDL